MLQQTQKDPGGAAGSSPDRRSGDQDRPLGAYAALTGTFLTAAGGFAVWLRRSGIEPPDRIAPGDLALVSVATHKLSRLIARDRIMSAIRAPFTRVQDDDASRADEAAGGQGLQRAIGELLTCPYCLDMWISAGFVGGLIALPRSTRWVATVFSVMAAADAMQIAYRKAQQTP